MRFLPGRARLFASADRHGREIFNAKKGKEIGLVQEACDSVEELDQLVASTQLAIANNSPMAIRACKQLIEAQLPPLAERRDFVASAIAGIRVSKEGQEGIQSFLSKTPAPWAMK